ncbi:exopolysaccharide biosynthesis GT4 family glycosyltransferase EpsE [Rathayibacter sp. YIM 133350]|uniref:exopolysaccharide biosynthesis GT4 family glycosyltransferase EpsE n=1 Tax=Rathayibacter sp. YIM 133350 TaxID=3131992 RepID=UPI00307DC83B
MNRTAERDRFTDIPTAALTRFRNATAPADLVVVIVTYNSAAHIDSCLASLRVASARLAVRVIIVDNASSDGTLDLVKRNHPDVMTLDSGSNLGYAGGINHARAHLGAHRALLILNPDLTLEPASLNNLISRLERAGSGIVVPRILSPDGVTYPSLRREPTLLATLGDAVFGGRWRGRPAALSETDFTRSHYTSPRRIDWATGAALMIDAKSAERLGTWNEMYFLFSEETDYMRRARDSGVQIWFEPSASVRHAQGGSGFSARLNALSSVNRIRYIREFHSRGYAAVYRLITVLAEVIRLRRPQNAGVLRTVLDERRWARLVPPRTRRSATLGYLVPEFPGQTHGFFWREIQWLRREGTNVDVVSTRRPAHGTTSHSWAAQAAGDTHYLAPLRPATLFAATAELLRAAARGRMPALVRALRTAAAERPTRLPRQALLVMVSAALVLRARRKRWDHLHVHSAADSAQIALYAHTLSGLPYSLTLHGPLADYGPNQHAKWSHASFGLVITEELRSELRERLGRATPKTVELAPMGVDPEQLTRRRPYRPWGNGEPVRLFSCGRLNPSKGHDDLIRAVALLVSEGRDVRLHIAGEDEHGGTGYHRVLDALIDRLGLRERVQLLGTVSEARIIEELEDCHVFTLASHAEPLGVAIMEAMAMGVPVVVTEGGGVAALVEDGVTGRFARANDAESLARVIAEVLHDSEAAMTLGSSGAAHIRRGFTSDNGAARIAQLMRPGPSAQTA